MSGKRRAMEIINEITNTLLHHIPGEGESRIRYLNQTLQTSCINDHDFEHLLTVAKPSVFQCQTTWADGQVPVAPRPR